MNNKCPKCGGEMEQGVIAHSGYGFFTAFPISTSQKLAKEITTFTIKIEVNKAKPINMVHHCKSCGFLESYAK